ncbi:hypothetical protein [Nonomuraea roseoviolacea]|uniref:Uncharacterized protein n=1 Tax=Nonomuraea roseoviolacea subsp. carminata TaxID=160689 RepID=A0ABT1JSG0_9ACTN|nr:hypothetical protein [Nonomuraea roseoviolacea]MCP2344530.1 hypothetical protein [Nonomuraea roseoviolacea subsp. carminata]
MRGIRSSRVLSTVLIIVTLLFVIRQPATAADTATKIFNWLTKAIDGLVVFASSLG